MRKRNSNTSSLKEAIERLMEVYRLGDKMLELDAVAAYKELMGDMIVNKTTEVFVSKKVLHIRVSSAPLRQELAYDKERLVKIINEKIGKQFLTGVVLK